MDRKRTSNIELLRIVSMVMIIFHHFSVHGGFDFKGDIVSFNFFWLKLISIGGKIGVNIFVLITGYYLVSSEKINIRKILKLHGQILFYSVTIYVAFMIFGQKSFDASNLVGLMKSFFPVLYNGWWFASTYFLLYLLFPYINVFLKSMTQEMYKKFLGLNLVIWCVVPTIFNVYYHSCWLIWFVFVYAVAGYIRLYGIKELSSKRYFILGSIIAAITYGLAIIIEFAGLVIPGVDSFAYYLYDMQNIAILFIAVCMFLGFKALDMGYVPWINKVAATVFGIYLIHDNELVRRFLWGEVFRNKEFIDSPYLALYSVVVMMIVFAGCAIIEWIRIGFADKVMVRLWEKHKNDFIKLYGKIKEKSEILKLVDRIRKEEVCKF